MGLSGPLGTPGVDRDAGEKGLAGKPGLNGTLGRTGVPGSKVGL